MTVSLRLAAVAVATVTGLVGVGLIDAPGARADTSVSDSATSQLQSAATATASSYASKATAASSAASRYAGKSKGTAKAKTAYVAKKKISTASAARLKVVLKSKKYSSSYKSTARKHSSAKAESTAAAKASYLAQREAALAAKAAAAAAKAVADAAKNAADAAAKALADALAAASGALDPVIPQLATDLLAASNNDAAMPTGSVLSNGRTWKQSYAEDFTTPAPLGRVLSTYPEMEAYSGFADTSGQGLYAPDRVLSVSNSNLDFHLHSENGQPLVAAVMPDGYKAHTTGRISIRYKSDDILGYKFVGMFWPSSDNWNDGEIDWPEANLGNAYARPASAVPGSYSGGRMNFKPNVEAFAATDQSAYHVATTEWDKTAIRYYWDGKLVSTVTDAVPTKAMRVTLQAETFIGEGTVPKNTSGHLDIDWISIWD